MTERDESARRRAWLKRVDISEPLRDLARLLGVDYDAVLRFEIEPTYAIATVLERDADGKFHINDLGYATTYQVRKDIRT